MTAHTALARLKFQLARFWMIFFEEISSDDNQNDIQQVLVYKEAFWHNFNNETKSDLFK